ncbi:hypothetical protein, partial [Priestia megaterium]|uniref:hypothetical protein n=1 Tax=Priestia megaterium TaxID=1404 RepID=UPI0035B64611
MTPGTLATALEVLRGVPRTAEVYRAATDAELLERAGLIAELRKLVEAPGAHVAGELLRRSPA